RPLDPVRHGGDDAGELGADAVRNLVQHRVPGEIHVLCEAAPEMRSPLRRRVAETQGLGIVAPVRPRAQSIVATVAPFAGKTGDVVLDEYEIALLDLLA